MSSNIRIKKICQHCNKVFTAKTTVTKFCSDICAKANYKLRQKEHKIELSQIDTEKQLVQIKSQGTKPLLGGYADSEMVSISGLAKMIGLSERTIFRLMKDPGFPKVKIGKKLLFKTNNVMEYLTSKYSI
ncbi:MAG: helix-turn-helix domain-containing protein [Chitinophagaceae bacterium]|nr:helix-turn-helix domain-containing protein [Chitinophagaceae bacterium]